MQLAHKPSQKSGRKPRSDLSASAAIVECASPIRTALSGIFARPINRMDDEAVQAALRNPGMRYTGKDPLDESRADAGGVHGIVPSCAGAKKPRIAA